MMAFYQCPQMNMRNKNMHIQYMAIQTCIYLCIYLICAHANIHLVSHLPLALNEINILKCNHIYVQVYLFKIIAQIWGG